LAFFARQSSVWLVRKAWGMLVPQTGHGAYLSCHTVQSQQRAGAMMRMLLLGESDFQAGSRAGCACAHLI
jgi:hypothetical protein